MAHVRRVVLIGIAAGIGIPASAEDLGQAWQQALAINTGLRARHEETDAARLNLGANERDRYGQLRNFTLNSLVTPQPRFNNNQGSSVTPGAGAGGGGSGGGTTAGFFGSGQNDTPLTFTGYTIPIYTGGRLLRTIDSSAAQLDGAKLEAIREAMDLKLTVAESYIDVLRSDKSVRVAISDVQRLSSFERDVLNQIEQGLATREDQLSAQVELARARQDLLQARETLASSWATYNRYLHRPADTVVPLDELAAGPPMTPEDPRVAEAIREVDRARRMLQAAQLRVEALREGGPVPVDLDGATIDRSLARTSQDPVELPLPLPPDATPSPTVIPGDRSTSEPTMLPLPQGAEGMVRALEARALQLRPELGSLEMNARDLDAQAAAQRAGLRPQVTLSLGHSFTGFNGLETKNRLVSTAFVNWTIGDFGATRRRTGALKRQADAARSDRADTAADVVLEVRTRWLTLDEARQRVPVAREAVSLSDEALQVVLDRYDQGLSTYTEVLNAEARRVQALNDFYDAAYDAVLASFRLRRAVGEI